MPGRPRKSPLERVGVLLAILWLAAFRPIPADTSLRTPPPADRTAAPAVPADRAPTPADARAISPFYVFREQGNRVWLERVQIFFTDAVDGKLKQELEQPRLRSLVYEALAAEDDEHSLEMRLRRELTRLLGPEVGRRLGFSRCYLLGP